MAEHPVDRLLRRVAATETDNLRAALLESPTFSGDLDWLTRLLDAADTIRLPEVPAELSAALHGLMAPPAPRRIESAAVLHDSRSDRELVGSRGATTTADGWTVALSAASADILIDGISSSPGSIAVSGHVLIRDGLQEALTVDVSGLVNRAVRTTELGTFDLGELPHGDYRFSVHRGDIDIEWTARVAP